MGRHKKLVELPTTSPCKGGLFLLRNGAIASVELCFPNNDTLGWTYNKYDHKLSLGWDHQGKSFTAREWDVVLKANEREKLEGVKGPW